MAINKHMNRDVLAQELCHFISINGPDDLGIVTEFSTRYDLKENK